MATESLETPVKPGLVGFEEFCEAIDQPLEPYRAGSPAPSSARRGRSPRSCREGMRRPPWRQCSVCII